MGIQNTFYLTYWQSGLYCRPAITCSFEYVEDDKKYSQFFLKLTSFVAYNVFPNALLNNNFVNAVYILDSDLVIKIIAISKHRIGITFILP